MEVVRGRSLVVVPALTITLAVASCTSGGDGKWGPLAVIDQANASAVNMASGGTGSLVVNDGCVFLRVGESREVTLFWRSGQVAWDAEAENVVFRDAREGELRLADGVTVSIGGSGPYKSTPDFKWLARPAESCPKTGFEVHSVVPAAQPAAARSER